MGTERGGIVAMTPDAGPNTVAPPRQRHILKASKKPLSGSNPKSLECYMPTNDPEQEKES